MRPLIFSTAQPPISMAWTQFVLKHITTMHAERKYLENFSSQLINQVKLKGFTCPSTSQIVPVIIGDSQQTVEKAQQLQKAGFYIMPVRPPTVPKGSSRLRISLNTHMKDADLEQLVHLL